MFRKGNTNCGGCGMSHHAADAAPRGGRAARAARHSGLLRGGCGRDLSAIDLRRAHADDDLRLAPPRRRAGWPAWPRSTARSCARSCLAGDGGTFDIGFASLSAAAERNEDILYICYDNEIYGNTGGQRSSATPAGAVTTNTPDGKAEQKKDILAIMAAHRIPYAASISLAHAEDTHRKLRYALDLKGFRFLHVLSPCPTGWKSEPALGLELVRLAVRSGLFPVYEIFDGKRHVVNIEPDFSDEALNMYLSLQRRFQKSGLDGRRSAPRHRPLLAEFARAWASRRHGNRVARPGAKAAGDGLRPQQL